MKKGSNVLCPYSGEYFPGKVVGVIKEKSWFGTTEERAIVEINGSWRRKGDKEWEGFTKYINVSISEIVEVD
jgi:hypothetical protein